MISPDLLTRWRVLLADAQRCSDWRQVHFVARQIERAEEDERRELARGQEKTT